MRMALEPLELRFLGDCNDTLDSGLIFSTENAIESHVLQQFHKMFRLSINVMLPKYV